MAEKNVTNEELARMVKGGFDAVDKRFDQTATKEDLNDLRLDMINQFGEVTRRLDNIEHLIAEEHRIRIERLEEGLQEVRQAIGIGK